MKKPYQKSESVRKLEDKLFEIKKRKYPNVPYLTKPEFRDDNANGLTKCIIAFIRLCGGQAERVNTTGIPVDNRKTYTDSAGITRTIGSVQWRKGTGTNGSADIHCVLPGGKALKVEIKIGSDRQSEFQKQYQKEVESVGGLYCIARDFESFVEWYKIKILKLK